MSEITEEIIDPTFMYIVFTFLDTINIIHPSTTTTTNTCIVM